MQSLSNCQRVFDCGESAEATICLARSSHETPQSAMLFVNLNLNLKQARISIKIPETICKNKIRLQVRRNGKITLNRIHKLLVGRNLNKFAFSPPSLRQFSCSKVDRLFYSLNFIIDCDFEYSIGCPPDDQCTLSLQSDHEMAIDWAYCCGDNQEKHLQSLKMTEDSKPGVADTSKAEASDRTADDNDDKGSNQQIYNLFAKQKLFTKFLVESSNRSEYLIVHKLGNQCLIAFDGAEELFSTGTESSRADVQCGEEPEDASGDVSAQELEAGEALESESDKSLRLDLIESIFVEFIYLDYDQRPEEVKKYRHSFDYEFLKLNSAMFDGLFHSLQRVNSAVLPLAAKHNLSTRFNYSYLLSDYAKV